jgi:hypothetical protein
MNRSPLPVRMSNSPILHLTFGSVARCEEDVRNINCDSLAPEL